MASTSTPPGSHVGKARRMAAAFVLAGLLAPPASAQWAPADLDRLAQSFAQSMSPDYTLRSYPWVWSSDCTGTQCFTDNPDTTYGYAKFSNLGTQADSARTMDAAGAMVFIAETPPAARYFGFTPYLYAKWYSAVPATGQPGYVPVYTSLTDTTHHLNVGTTGGANPFSQLAVYVITADSRAAADIRARFTALGFPSTAVNLHTLPLANVPAVPLAMGNGARKDTYAALFRVTFPQDPAALAAYLARSAVRAFYVEPATARAVTPLPPTVYKVPGTGQSEATALRRARDQLVTQLLNRYQPQFTTTTETSLSTFQTRNYRCVSLGISCAGDNPDTFYVSDFGGASLAAGANDRFLVVGVQHSGGMGTGKATYFSHSLSVGTNNAGLIAVADSWLEGTALKAAGITSPSDPRYATYSRLYAFYFSYSCATDDPICVPIPSDPEQGGVAPGTPLQMHKRVYLEPATGTRPSTSEVVMQRVFWLQK